MKLFNDYRNKVLAAGSPFRHLRKIKLYAQHPGATLARRRTASALQLAPELRSTVKTLSQSGYCMAGNEIDQGLLSELAVTCAPRIAEVKINTAAGEGKNFWQKLLDTSNLTTDSIFVRYALQPDVLNIVSGYFGEVPYLAYVQLIISYGTENNSWQSSQLWHLDYDDSKMIKLWTYLTDVTDLDYGPFTLLPAKPSSRVTNTFFPGRVSDEQVERQAGTENFKRIMGPKNTSFYVDTYRCYHQGSRLALNNIRIGYVATYISHASLYPFTNKITQNTALSELQKRVITL